jgi:hypothetical protein
MRAAFAVVGLALGLVPDADVDAEIYAYGVPDADYVHGPRAREVDASGTTDDATLAVQADGFPRSGVVLCSGRSAGPRPGFD